MCQAGRRFVLWLTREVTPQDRGPDDDAREPGAPWEIGHCPARIHRQRVNRKLGAIQYRGLRRCVARRHGADQQLLGVRADATAAHGLRGRELERELVGQYLSRAVASSS